MEPVLTVPPLEKFERAFESGGPLQCGTWEIASFEEIAHREEGGRPFDGYLAHNPGATHQVNVWAFGATPEAAHAALVARLAKVPAAVRLVEGGDFRTWQEAQTDWEERVTSMM